MIDNMDNRQCLGLDKFHQCLLALFPSNADGQEVGRGSSVASTGTDCDAGKRITTRNKSDSVGSDLHPRIPVKFTKNAVELLRETLTAFLRKVGRGLVEELEDHDPMSQQPIRPEDVVRVLVELDDNDADDDEDGENTKKNANAHSSTNTNRFPDMKEIIRQAQDLLLERARLEDLESEQSTKLQPKRDNQCAGRTKKTTKRGRVVPAGGETKDSLATDAVAKRSEMTTIEQQQPPKKRRGRRKKPKVKITAEMEAEQERLLNASKKALESSQQQQGGGGEEASFRVELS